jgi:hypothetical protein
MKARMEGTEEIKAAIFDSSRLKTQFESSVSTEAKRKAWCIWAANYRAVDELLPNEEGTPAAFGDTGLTIHGDRPRTTVAATS